MDRYAALVSSFLAGSSASVGQILILRELLVLFHGNELSTGIIFAGWLLWTAAGSRFAGTCRARPNPDSPLIFLGLTVLAFLLPSTLLLIRASRILWSIPAGELIPFHLTIAIVFSSTSLFCLSSGGLFTLIWSFQARIAGRGGGPRPIAIYGGEALGAAAGGLAFFFLLLERTAVLTSALIVSTILMLAGLALHAARKRTGGLRHGVAVFSCAFILLALAFAWSDRLDGLSRRWEWGSNLLAVRDTPFHNLALFNKDGQFSLFANGLWLFSYPDSQTAEYAVHVAMLEHPAPRTVLLVGGGAAGLVPEILKHPGMERIDYVEADPEVIRLARAFLPERATSSPGDDRMRVHLVDAASFVRCVSHRYDVVLLNVGDPMTAEMNRFYTVEFFTDIKAVLTDGGVFSFSVSSSPDVVGPAQANLLKTLYTTLRSVFPAVIVIPGDAARFLACSRQGVLVSNPDEITKRIDERNLDLQYVRDYYLFDYMNPLRIEYLVKILSQGPTSSLNRDFEPICSFNSLIVWGIQVHPLLGDALQRMSGIDSTLLWVGLGTVLCLLIVAFKWMAAGRRAAVSLNVMAVGGTMMSVELILLLSFQILRGYVYRELALIVALFMTGTAMGAAATIVRPLISRPLTSLSLVQGLLSLYLVGVWKVLVFLQAHPQGCHGEEFASATVFPILALIAGFLGGLHFSVAVTALSGQAGARPEIGAVLYASDLAGAAAGTLAASLFLLPVFGVETTLRVLAVLCLGTLPTLIRT